MIITAFVVNNHILFIKKSLDIEEVIMMYSEQIKERYMKEDV